MLEAQVRNEMPAIASMQEEEFDQIEFYDTNSDLDLFVEELDDYTHFLHVSTLSSVGCSCGASTASTVLPDFSR